jgi:hypothetical protein
MLGNPQALGAIKLLDSLAVFARELIWVNLPILQIEAHGTTA